MECTKINCPMQAGTPTDNCGENCPWRTTAKLGDLISRAALLNDLSYCAPELFFDKDYLATKIIRQPAVDAVEVVRCRDCVYYNTVGCGEGFGWCENAVINSGVFGDFYCACGEGRIDA